jgi:hypothetical protein
MCNVKTYTNNIDCLSTYLKIPVLQALNHFDNLIVAQTYRTAEYQAYLYWASRNEIMHEGFANLLGIKPMKAERHLTSTLRSLHTVFCAIDLYFIDKDKKIINNPTLYIDLYDFLNEHSLDVNIVWGGTFKIKDYGHYELALTDTVKDKLFEKKFKSPKYVDVIIKDSLKRQKKSL